MKHPTGYAKPRRLAAPRKQVRLNLQRRRVPEPEDELDTQQKSQFWKWVVLVALLHLMVLSLAYWFYRAASATKPPEQFISLLPEGDVVKGTPGARQAHKLGPTTPAPAAHHASSSPAPPTPAVFQPPKPAPSLADKPIPKPPPPKVKVDLTLVDRSMPATAKPAKPKHPKKQVAKTTDDSEDQDHEAEAKPDSSGLSKEQIAEKLGEKLDASGIKKATHTGTSGSADSHANPYADFYASIRDQVMSLWQSPNLTDETAVNPVVQIHVEKDGRVPPESVQLIQSSGNSTYDDSALAAAKSLGYLHEPLPDGCPPDIPITFKLTR
ncbi:MAG: TonB C-terminal domain-containing protein [Methylacidiphilales bacterium]|nr:TonB C-terminal domain-containing protein [Candidatus Methylacidiphilales bacterium]